MTSLPIGYLIKLLDGLIEADLNRTLDRFGIGRRQWQVLNLLTAGPLNRTDIAARLAPFLVTPEAAPGVVDVLVRGGWVGGSAESMELTTAGRDLLERAGREVAGARSRVSEGVSRESYQTTVDTLDTMCRNLGWDGP